MNKLIELKKLDFQYWIDELPELKVNHTIEKVMEVGNVSKALNDKVQIALELSLHRHISSYALLGFNYVPEKHAETLKVRFQCCEENSINYLGKIKTGSLAEYVYCGMDESLLAAVREEVFDFSEENPLPAGELNFNVAANCEVSSSPFIFRAVTEILLNILITVNKEMTADNEYLDDLFIENISKSVLK